MTWDEHMSMYKTPLSIYIYIRLILDSIYI
jgi:hypothetical protein